MITLTEFETILIACLPALTSILSIVSAVAAIFKALNKLKDNENLKVERNSLYEQNKLLASECRKMRKQMAYHIEKTSHVVYKDITEVQNDKDLQV